MKKRVIKNTIPRIYSNKENSDIIKISLKDDSNSLIIKLFKELYKYTDVITSYKEQIKEFQMKLLDNNDINIINDCIGYEFNSYSTLKFIDDDSDLLTFSLHLFLPEIMI